MEEESHSLAARRNPIHATSHFSPRVLRQKRGGFKEAEESYSLAARLNPTHAPSHFNLGVQQRGDFVLFKDLAQWGFLRTQGRY